MTENQLAKKFENFNWDFFKVYQIQRFLLVEIGLVLLAGIITPLCEQPYSQANIKTFGDAVWWAVITITSVGYGDKFPLSWTGKIIGGILAISGVSIFGLITAVFGVYFLRKRDDFYSKRNYKYLDHLSQEIEDLKKEVEFLIKKK